MAASGAVLMGCMALGLVGWFAADAGSHGDTRDAIRVGADGWLLAHGAHLHLATGAVSATVTAVPLGLTLLCVYVAHRLGLWAARTSAVEDPGTVLLGTVVMSGLYGVVALLTAVLAATATAESSLLRAFAGGFAVAFVGGGSGILAGSREVVDWRSKVPETVRAVLKGGLAATLLLTAASAGLLAVALLLDLGSAANVLSRLHTDATGGLLYTALVAAVAPNAVLLTGSYLLGPGFAVGTGTVVSPAAVVLGPVPAFPLLAALPSEGTQPGWLSVLVALPVLAGALAAVLVVRRFPAYGFETGAVPRSRLGGGRRGPVHPARRRLRRCRRSRPDGRPRRRPVADAGRGDGRDGHRLVSSAASAPPGGRAVGSLRGVSSTPARLVVLVSGSGTNLQALLDAIAPTRRTAPRSSPSAPTATASRGSSGPSGPACPPSCAGSRTTRPARSGTRRSPRPCRDTTRPRRAPPAS